MELLERYLQGVRFWLPRGRQQDIIAELSEDIRSEIEEKEGELGRQVNEGEMEAVLKRWGPPMVVAHRYLPQRYLIGPVLYPIYLLLLKLFAAIWVIPWLLVWLGMVSFSPEYRAHDPIQNLKGLWLSVLYTGFIGTAAFAIVDSFIHPKALACKEWDPRQLPSLSSFPLIPRSNSLFGLTMYLIVLVWCLLHIPAANVVTVAGSQVTLASMWRFFFWAVVVLAAVRSLHWGVNLFRPYWTKRSLILRLLLDVAAAVVYCGLFKAQLVLAITGPNVSPHAIEDFDAFRFRAFWVVLGLCLTALACDVWRLRGLARRGGALAPALAALLVAGLAPHQAAAQTTSGCPDGGRGFTNSLTGPARPGNLGAQDSGGRRECHDSVWP
jgi:hypothetical protein